MFASLARLSFLAIVLAAGCTNARPVFNVSGTVTFDGQPVPAGIIYFNPDFSQGNDGPQGVADIKDGKFDTSKGGRGHCGGAMVVRIEGFDGKSPDPKSVGKPLFVAFELNRDLPRQNSSQDFEVPASAAQGLTPSSNPPP